MPYVNNKGINIHYKTVGNGEPLVLMHGFAGNINDWYNFGYVKELKEKFTLILIDSRGHGLSDKPLTTEKYKAECRAKDVIAVMDDLKIELFHYLGYSSGATIGFSLLEHYSDRLSSIILGGNHPYRSEEGANYMLNLFNMGLDKFVEVLESTYGELTSDTKNQLLSNDINALLSAIPQAWPGFEHILHDIKTPCMFYVGENDCGIKTKLTKALSDIQGYKFHTLPELDHWQGYTKSELVIPHILNFLNK